MMGAFDGFARFDAEQSVDFPPSLPLEAYADDAPINGRPRELAARLLPLSKVRPITDQTYLVKGWLGRGAFSVVYGESNVGKTFLALDMALHVAAGTDWHGARIKAPGTVIYVAAEGGAGINNRLEAARRNSPDLVNAAESRFYLLPLALDLCAKGDAGALIEALSGLGAKPDLIVVDTLARSLGAGDENTGQDMGAFIASVDRIRAATGAHVMVIHHAGKDSGRGARGHSSLRGAADTEVELTRDGAVISAVTRKQRDMEGGKLFAYSLHGVHLGNDQDNDPITSCVVLPTEAPAKRGPVIAGQAKVALQAFGDALAHHGERKTGDMFPRNRQCVSLEKWRDFCDRHDLSGGETATAKRTAFHKAKGKLHELGVVCVVDGYAWRVAE